MQDRYVGDVGDFGKYGLLRSLCGADDYGPGLRLGVLWYKFDGKDNVNNGGHTEYICNPSPAELHLRECDRDLYEKMRQLVESNRRLVTVLEKKRRAAHSHSLLQRGPELRSYAAEGTGGEAA